MQELQELARLYVQFGKNRSELFDEEGVGANATKMKRLFEGIVSGKIVNEETAKSELYGSLAHVPISTFHSIKMRLMRKLFANVAALDAGKAFKNPRSGVRQECANSIAIMKILILYGAEASPKYLAERTLRTALKYHLTTPAKESLRVLCHLAAYSGQAKEFEDLSTQYRKCMEAEVAEESAALLLEGLSVYYVASLSLRQENLEHISRACREVAQMCRTHETAALYEIYFMLSKMYCEVSQDYESVFRLLREIKEYYAKVPLVANKTIYSGFLISAMSANIWTGNFSESHKLAQEIKEVVPSSRAAWFTFQEQYWILAMRTRDYVLARSIFLEVVTHPRFRRDDPVMLERWQLMEFYVRFVDPEPMRVSLLPEEQLKSRRKYKHFRAFASTFSVLSKDLQGFNVVAVFAQILFLLRIRDFDSLIQRDESLQTLRRKRLSTLNYRLTIFAQLIHVMVEQNFELPKIQKASAVWLNKLSNVPAKFKGGAAESLEIVPLEDLWTMMLEELSQH